MNLSAEVDADIGQEMYRRLQRLLETMAKKHQLPAERMTDFLVAGVLFVAADRYERSIDDTLEIVDGIARSVQEDDLGAATRH